MTVTDKIKELQKKRKEILKKANKAIAKLEKDFRADTSKTALTDKIKSYNGRFYAVVGPLLKQAKEIQNAIVLFSK
jgi:hypothetical protein